MPYMSLVVCHPFLLYHATHREQSIGCASGADLVNFDSVLTGFLSVSATAAE